MRFVLALLLMIAIALGVGFGLSYYALTDGRLFGVAEVGPWTAWPDTGSATPNPYTRSHLTRVAALQLGSAEGLQFVAVADSAGEPLLRECSYRLDGKTPLATFWTLVAVDPDGRNLAADDAPLAVRSSDLARPDDGTILLSAGSVLRPGNWLELAPGTGPFELVLTLYDTAVFSGFSNDESMPAILKEACA